MQRRLILLSPLALAACGSVLPKQTYIAPTDWPLEPPPPNFAAANPAGAVLLVRGLSAAPGLDEQGIRSLRADGSLDISYYNRWAVPPADAATQALITWAEASGAFAAVISPGSRLPPTRILEGELTEFIADIPAGMARVVLTLVVISPNAAKSHSVAQTRIVGRAALHATTPSAEAAALQAALADALSQVVSLLQS